MCIAQLDLLDLLDVEEVTIGVAPIVPAVAPARGRGRPPDHGLVERDRLFRVWHRQHHPELSAHAAAELIARDLGRYRSSAWQRERTDDTVPARHLGRPTEIAWSILRLRDFVPSPRSIRRSLSN
ncbi:hypothetical protein [Rhodoplanes azumiensis]|uniref:Uncharacterized protein n=1 Tax=Rhodoplanes azumiensis TaxID=1897628 RepID=A0ABW5ALM9_9BRAD